MNTWSCMYFIDAFPWWLASGITYPLMILWVLGWLNWLVNGWFWWYVHDWSLSIFFVSLRGPPIKFHISYPFHPCKLLYHPNLGFWFLTSSMILFSQDELSKMFRRSIIILPRIYKLLSFCLTGFWRRWLFNYPLTFTLTFPILKWMDWHGTKGVPS